jgi:dienelactone hydrolase
MLKESNLIASQLEFLQADRAVIILPEIFGLNNFIHQTTDTLSLKLNLPVFGLDIFYPILGQRKITSYSNFGIAAELKNKLTSELFINLLKENLDRIQTKYPQIKKFSVLGFCFGGRLAYLSGIDNRINKIVACYGSGMNTPYFKNLTSIEALTKERKFDSSLRVLSIFGSQDFSISSEDKNVIIAKMLEAEIDYSQIIVPAGHAFLNFERPEVYSPLISNQVWPDIYNFLLES